MMDDVDEHRPTPRNQLDIIPEDSEDEEDEDEERAVKEKGKKKRKKKAQTTVCFGCASFGGSSRLH